MSTHETTPSMLEWALYYVSLGWHVIPLYPGSKIPNNTLIAHGVHNSSNDPETVRSWFTKVPDGNIGLAAANSGLTIFDFDSKVDESGMVQYGTDYAPSPIPSDAVVARTPSGGIHVICDAIPGATQRKPWMHTDVRVIGYIVAPPSQLTAEGSAKHNRQHSTKPYTVGHYVWVSQPMPERRSTTAPGPWVDAVLNGGLVQTQSTPSTQPVTTEQSAATPAQSVGVFDSDYLRQAPTLLESIKATLDRMDAAVEGSGGQGALLRVMRVLTQGYLLTDDAAEAAFSTFYNPRCVPPWNPANAADVADVMRKLRESRIGSTMQPGACLPTEFRAAAGLPVAAVDFQTLLVPGLPTMLPQLTEAEMFDDVFDDSAPPDVPPSALIPGLIFQASTTLVYGPTNCGKSFFAVDLATTVAGGRSFLGRYPAKAPRKVVYIPYEDYAGVKERIRGCTLAGLYPQGCRNIKVMRPELFRDALLTKAHEPAFARMMNVLKEQAPDMVIIDTWAKSIAGGDENDNGKMADYLRAAERIRISHPQCAVVIIHHSGKDPLKGPRGGTSLNGSVDTTLVLAEIPASKEEALDRNRPSQFSVQGGKARRTRRAGEVRGKIMEIQLTYKGQPVLTEDGDPVTTAYVDYTTHDPIHNSPNPEERRFMGPLVRSEALTTFREFIWGAGGPGVATVDQVTRLYAEQHNRPILRQTLAKYARELPADIALTIDKDNVFQYRPSNINNILANLAPEA